MQKLYVDHRPYKEVELDSGSVIEPLKDQKHAVELIQKAYESKWKKEKLLVYAKNEKEHRQQKIEEELSADGLIQFYRYGEESCSGFRNK